MTGDSVSSPAQPIHITWRSVWKALTRPYHVTFPMILLVSLVPFYLVIAERAGSHRPNMPEFALDYQFRVSPSWALVYGAFYAFLIVLPMIIVQQAELVRRSVLSYLTIWSISYACFLVYPTIAPRPAQVIGDDFAAWGLRFLYGADPPYNCFPSLHVAHSFVSTLAAFRVHRMVGLGAIVCALFVAISTLFTKQHYVADVVGGIVLAFLAYCVFLHGYARANIPEAECRIAPVLALGLVGFIGFGVACVWALFQLGLLG